MKTIDERARDLVNTWDGSLANDLRDDLISRITTALREVARDQCRACTEAVRGVRADKNFRIDRGQAVQSVMNAKLGEQQPS